MDTPLDTTWPSVRADLAKLADELCYPDEGDRCFDGRPDDLKAFLDSHPTYRTAHEAAFQAPSPAVGPGSSKADRTRLATELLAQRNGVDTEASLVRRLLSNANETLERCTCPDNVTNEATRCVLTCLRTWESTRQPLETQLQQLDRKYSELKLQILGLKCDAPDNRHVECF